jgi:WhiB family transcriptional regulator, redox-sensing transcriptional regulator
MSGSKPARQQPHGAATRGTLRIADAAEPTGWVSQALCRTQDPDSLFVRGAAQREAALVCRRCPVMAECGAEALDNRVEFGVWGGMTERQRRALLQRHPEMVSWSRFLNEQRNRSTG